MHLYPKKCSKSNVIASPSKRNSPTVWMTPSTLRLSGLRLMPSMTANTTVQCGQRQNVHQRYRQRQHRDAVSDRRRARTRQLYERRHRRHRTAHSLAHLCVAREKLPYRLESQLDHFARKGETPAQRLAVTQLVRRQRKGYPKPRRRRDDLAAEFVGDDLIVCVFFDRQRHLFAVPQHYDLVRAVVGERGRELARVDHAIHLRSVDGQDEIALLKLLLGSVRVLVDRADVRYSLAVAHEEKVEDDYRADKVERHACGEHDDPLPNGLCVEGVRSFALLFVLALKRTKTARGDAPERKHFAVFLGLFEDRGTEADRKFVDLESEQFAGGIVPQLVNDDHEHKAQHRDDDVPYPLENFGGVDRQKQHFRSP